MKWLIAQCWVHGIVLGIGNKPYDNWKRWLHIAPWCRCRWFPWFPWGMRTPSFGWKAIPICWMLGKGSFESSNIFPIIMVQWKITLNERKRSYWRYSHFPLNNDWVVVSNLLYVHPIWGKWSMTSIFFRWVRSTTFVTNMGGRVPFHPIEPFNVEAVQFVACLSWNRGLGVHLNINIKWNRSKHHQDIVKRYIWSNYSDLTRPHPKWWCSKGNPLISGKSGLVKYYNLTRHHPNHLPAWLCGFQGRNRRHRPFEVCNGMSLPIAAWHSRELITCWGLRKNPRQVAPDVLKPTKLPCFNGFHGKAWL